MYNLCYIQSLFTIVSEMNRTEQQRWSNGSENVTELNRKYLGIIAMKLLETNYHSIQEHVGDQRKDTNIEEIL